MDLDDIIKPQYLVNPDVPEPGVGRLGHHCGNAKDDGQLAGAGVRGHAADHDIIIMMMIKCQ